MANEPDPRPRSEPESGDQTIVDWKEMAAWWDKQQGDEGDFWHRTLIDPTLLRVLGSLEGQHVLDLACGNGYIARKLARAGARVTGVDASAPIMEHASSREEREPLGIVYHVAEAHLDTLDEGTFDAVVCNMALMDIPDAKGALREAARMLRSGGRLVISLPHPCFAVGLYHSGWAVEKFDPETTVWRKVSRYREVFQHPMIWRDDSGGEWYTPGYHRPLSWYLRALRGTGFVVSAFEEPEPTEEFMAEDSEGAWIEQIPLHCVIEAYKFKP